MDRNWSGHGFDDLEGLKNGKKVTETGEEWMAKRVKRSMRKRKVCDRIEKNREEKMRC